MKWQVAEPLSRRRENSVGNRRCDARNARLARTPER